MNLIKFNAASITIPPKNFPSSSSTDQIPITKNAAIAKQSYL